MFFACKNARNDSKVCCPLIGQKNTKVFWHQSEARTAAAVWNCSGKTLGAIHSTKIQTGPTGKRGPPQKVDPFFRNFSGWTEPIHWVLDRNFRKFWLNGSRPLSPGPRGSSPRSLLFFAPFFPARLVFPLPPQQSAPGSLRMRVTPPWNVYKANCDHDWEGYPFWQTGLPTLTGHSTYHEPWFPVDIFFLSILMVRLFHIRYFENGPLEPGYPSCKRDEI